VQEALQVAFFEYVAIQNITDPLHETAVALHNK
jgi:hypothetical protein